MIMYLIYIIIFLGFLFPAIYFIRRKPDLSFWLLLNIYFDPGGYITYYLGGKTFLNFYLSDITIILIIFCLFSIKTNYKVIYKDKFLINFYKFFFIFAVYFFLFYGGIVPYLNNDLNYVLFLQKNRTFFYYIIILTSAYIFTLRSLKYFFLTTLFFGVMMLSIFLITLLTGLKLIPIDIFERYYGSGIMRIGMVSWGLFHILFPISFILFLFSRKIKFNLKYRKLVYLSGILMILTLLVALSRRSFISIPGTILIIIILNSLIFKRNKILLVGKILLPLCTIMIIIYLAFPKYVGYIVDISQDTFLLLTKGQDTRGEGEYRISGTGELQLTKKYIANNFIFGSGYSYVYWGNTGEAVSARGSEYSLAADAAAEVFIYYIFFGYGLVGFIILMVLYSFLIKLFLKLYFLLKNHINYLTEYPYEILFAIFILYTIIDKFTFSLYSLGQDFTASYYGILIGIGFALLQKLKIITSNIEKVKLQISSE